MFKRMLVASALLAAMTNLAPAADVVTTKNIGMELARDIASETIKACRGMGYQVSAVVVDRGANLRAALRDDLAARFTLDIAHRKANMSVMAGMDTGPFREARGDIRLDLNQISGLIVMEGGIIISAGGNRIGAVGVSGAPGGDKDAECAKQAIEAVFDRLEFAD